jgi:thiosulfate/3-mercaptopyruvate sulfurtransferase
MSMHKTLIDPSTLASRLGDPNWVVIDCRFDLTNTEKGEELYREAHIPGARYAHLDDDLARHPTAKEGRHPLPDPKAFAATLSGWGIDRDSTVVAYDDASGAIAARLWWLLRWLGHERCAVLDGGFAAWQDAGRPVEQAAPRVVPRRYTFRGASVDAVVGTADVAARQAAGDLLVDARGAPRYRGEQEPIDPKAGHVPGAHNRPFSANVTSGGKFRPAAELFAELNELLAERAPSSLIAMCGSGVTACHLLLAMEVAGLPGGRLYAGSWSEWIRDPARPIRSGPAP